MDWKDFDKLDRGVTIIINGDECPNSPQIKQFLYVAMYKKTP